MNTIEDRLRAATQAAADTVSRVQPAAAAAASPGPELRTRRPRIGAPRLMASVAAATAIVAVVATVMRDPRRGRR